MLTALFSSNQFWFSCRLTHSLMLQTVNWALMYWKLWKQVSQKSFLEMAETCARMRQQYFRQIEVAFCNRSLEQNSSLSILYVFIDQYYHQSFLGNFPVMHSRSMTKMLIHSYPLPRRGVGSVQAGGDVFSLNYLSPCISVRGSKKCTLC